MTVRNISVSSQPPTYSNSDENDASRPVCPATTTTIDSHALPAPIPAPDYHPRSASDNQSLLPDYTPAKFGKFGRYKDEEAYLEAMRSWADERSHVGLKNGKGDSTTIEGFYGAKTMQDYENQERPKLGFRRRSSAARESADESCIGESPGTRRRGSIANWLRRKKTESESKVVEE